MYRLHIPFSALSPPIMFSLERPLQRDLRTVVSRN